MSTKRAVSLQSDLAPSQGLLPVHRTLYEFPDVAVIQATASGDILHANGGALSMLDAPSIDALRTCNLVKDLLKRTADRIAWRSAAAGVRQRNVELQFRSMDGRTVHLKGEIHSIQTDNKPLLCGLFTDATELRQLQNALDSASHSEAVDSLSSGVVHDVNNLFTVLVGNLYLVAEGLRNEPKLLDKVKRARNAAKRGADLTRQLLNFARPDLVEVGAVSPAKLIGNLEPLLDRAVGAGVSISIDCNPDVGMVKGLAAHIESAIVNLVMNARDALDGSGLIRISASNQRIDKSPRQDHEVINGEFVRISVADNGPGMPDAVRERAFEPFYSTKGPGKGTGLGLSIVKRMCQQLGGAVELRSRLGHGTRVSMFLPRQLESAGDTTIKTIPLMKLPSGDESVLVLSRDEEICGMVCQVLETLGYQVTTHRDSSDYPQRGNQPEVDLVLLDRDSAIRRMSPTTVTDRYADGSAKLIVLDDNPPADEKRAYRVLRKPFTLLELATCVRNVLDGDSS